MKIAVVGGGLGGLVAARALVAAGHDAHVLEAAPRAGGVIATSTVDGYLREHAASSFLGGAPHGVLALCRELGVATVKAAKAAKHRWIYIDGKLRELPRDPISLARSDLLTWRGKLALVREPFAPPRPRGEDESMHAFAARRLGAEAARAIVAPFVTGVFAADSHDISLEAGFPRLSAFDDAGGLVRGGLALLGRAVVARVRGDERPARGLWAPVGGVGALVDALAASLGDRVRLGARVGALAPVDGGVALDGERWDGAVLALPAPAAAALVDGALPELATKLAAFHRTPVAVVYLGFAADAAPRDALGGFGFLVAQGEHLRVLGCVYESTVWPDRAPAGHVLLRCIFGGGRDAAAAALADAELVELARHDLAEVLGIDAEPTHTSVVKHARGIAHYAVGHRVRVREASAVARVHRVVLAGADYRGVGLNDLCGDGAAIVDEVSAWR